DYYCYSTANSVDHIF
nr:immunoglobulin light chain junction region [Macaca mulatta]